MKRMRNSLIISGLAVLSSADLALAHATEGGIVLLLPTGHYILGGLISVILTVVLVSLMPDTWGRKRFQPYRIFPTRTRRSCWGISLGSLAVLAFLITAGGLGAHDPMRNPLSLGAWTLFWVLLVVIQGFIGDLWRVLNPWIGLYTLLRKLGWRRFFTYPSSFGYGGALISFGAFAAVLLVHPAPSEPDILAPLVALYWGVHMLGMIIFGPRWLRRVEGLSVLLRAYALMAVPGRYRGAWSIGLPGWRILQQAIPPASLAIFVVAILALGSFDGLNETFWWMGLVGVNPLEYPGRSAMVGANALGMIGALLLVPVFAVMVWFGAVLARQPRQFSQAFCTQALALMPIALAYHFSHYLPSFLVEIQYAIKTVSDPLGRGSDLLGLGQFYVTTGFLNTHATVQAIWLTQAGAVVLGHAVAIVISHVQAVRVFGGQAAAVRAQWPLALFMICYTLFGLWLLASPRAV